MRNLSLSLAVCCAAILSFPANAVENWTVTDLGSTRTESLCVDIAAESLLSFSHVFGARRILKAQWTVYGYGLNRSKHDAVITCTFATANATRATLVVYSEDEIQGGLVSNRLAQIFYETNDRLERKWLAEAYERFGF